MQEQYAAMGAVDPVAEVLSRTSAFELLEYCMHFGPELFQEH